jgi:methyl-accepting chemotaxis protein-1 (serine sensor receptor)
MLSKLTLRFRLIATLAVLGLLIAAIGVLGIYGMRSNHAALEQVYSNQLASSIAINNSKNFLNRARFGLDRAVFHPDAPDVAKTIARAKGFIDDANKSWQTYLAMPRNGEEAAYWPRPWKPNAHATSMTACWRWPPPSSRVMSSASKRCR